MQVKHGVTGQDTLISLAGPANKQGRIAADNICGGDSRYSGSQGSSVIRVFDMTGAATALRAGFGAVRSQVRSPRRPVGSRPRRPFGGLSCFPGAAFVRTTAGPQEDESD